MAGYEELTPQEFEREAEMKKSDVVQPAFSLVMLQAALCALLLVLLYGMKILFPETYTELRSLYDTEMERSVLIEYDDLVSDV